MLVHGRSPGSKWLLFTMVVVVVVVGGGGGDGGIE